MSELSLNPLSMYKNENKVCGGDVIRFLGINSSFLHKCLHAGFHLVLCEVCSKKICQGTVSYLWQNDKRLCDSQKGKVVRSASSKGI